MATKRTNNVLDQLRILGNLSNKSYYDYTEAEVNAIFKAVDDQLKAVKAKFRGKRKKFKL